MYCSYAYIIQHFILRNNNLIFEFWLKSSTDCRKIEFSALPTLASGASIARGNPRTIGQKPDPTIRRGMIYKGSLREGTGAEGD